MILNVSKRRGRALTLAGKAGLASLPLYDRERRALVMGGHAQPTEADRARIARAEAKRARKAEKQARLA